MDVGGRDDEHATPSRFGRSGDRDGVAEVLRTVAVRLAGVAHRTGDHDGCAIGRFTRHQIGEVCRLLEGVGAVRDHDGRARRGGRARGERDRAHRVEVEVPARSLEQVDDVDVVGVEPVNRVEQLSSVERDGDAAIGLNLARDRAAGCDQEHGHVTDRVRCV